MTSRSLDHLNGLSPQQRAEVEDRIEAFERAWQSGERPAIADHLSADADIRVPLLVELVQIDREWRIKRGDRASIEAYQKEFPELAAWIKVREALGDLNAPIFAGEPGQSLAEQPGATIGPYKLLAQIGVGGFGLVFVAEQQRPVRRKVALKVIKPGMDTREVVARFEAERQALALMDHPNIARVIDGGTTDSGRPYFVMELVHGVPITEYCDKTHLSLRERLELFVRVCQAVQHAHQKGIVHRDIKPSNVLVTEQDGMPVVKVIDFGVAKALYQPLTEKTVHTQFAQMIGTPLYMSPEQAEMGGLDIDTRSDIYSLGVLLYELLTGTTPFDRKRLIQAAYDELLRIIRDEEPPRPSTRLSSLGETATTLAGNRGLDVKRLSQVLAGDLDWVVMKALEKDRNRRYDSPSAFAEDIERYLDDEAISARPPSKIYQLRKFAHRNRASVLTTAVVAAALVTGTVVSAWQALRAVRAEGTALSSAAHARRSESAALVAAESEKQAKNDSLQREAETKAVLEFVENRVFSAAQPERESEGLGRKVTLLKAIESAVHYLDKEFAGKPLIEARLRASFGKSFARLGDPEKAAQQDEAAHALYARYRGSEHPDTLAAVDALANDYCDLGRFKEAVKLQVENLAILKATRGPDHLDTLKSMNNLAVLYFEMARHDESLKLREETLARGKATLGPENVETLAYMQNLAQSYYIFGRYAEGVGLYEEALANQKRTLGAKHPDTLISMHNLAAGYAALGRYADALKLQEATLSLRQSVLGPDHPFTLSTMGNLARTYDYLGRHADAAKLNEQTLALRKAKLGASHPNTLSSMYQLAISDSALGRHVDALKLFEETLALRKAKLGPNHRQTLETTHKVAEELCALDRDAEALPIIDECMQRATGLPLDPLFLPSLMHLRVQHFQKTKDAAGCRKTAMMWEKLNRIDGLSLYHAASFRSVTAAVLLGTDKSTSHASEADLEAEQAMSWLKQAVAAGYKDATRMQKDEDLAALRSRDDFKKLVANLERENPTRSK